MYTEEETARTRSINWLMAGESRKGERTRRITMGTQINLRYRSRDIRETKIGVARNRETCERTHVPTTLIAEVTTRRTSETETFLYFHNTSVLLLILLY